MPTYQYECTSCGHEFELVQSFSDDPASKCPKCEGSVRKVYANVGIVFKGSGFYKTDSRGGSSTTPEAKPEAKPAAEPAKPAAAKETKSSS